MANIIERAMSGMTLIVVGTALLPVVIDSITGITESFETLPTGVEPLLNIIPMLFVVIMVLSVVYYIKSGSIGKK